MCKLKSAIILKDEIFLPDYDSHSDMLEELKIADTKENAERLFVRAELYPKNGDVFTNPKEWIYHVDQDILPEWYVPSYEEQRMREAVEKWYSEHVHIGEEIEKINSGSHWIKGCKVEYIYGNATVEYIYDNATVEYIYDNAMVKYICGNATVKNIYGNAMVKYICDNATVKNICGDATVKYIYDNAMVKYICDNATVENIYGNAMVKYIYGDATVENIYGNATVITGPYTVWKNSGDVKISGNAIVKDNLNRRILCAGNWEIVKK